MRQTLFCETVLTELHCLPGEHSTHLRLRHNLHDHTIHIIHFSGLGVMQNRDPPYLRGMTEHHTHVQRMGMHLILTAHLVGLSTLGEMARGHAQ